MSAWRAQLARFHAAITGAAPLASARDLVRRDDIDELDRLQVYAYAYTARIAGVLVHDYPKLAALVGEATLRGWTAAYLRAHPPASFTLREVGAQLATWLAHAAELAPLAELDRARAADLARLERARTEVFDGPDARVLAREDLATLDPAEFPALQLQLVPASALVALTTNADDAWDALEEDRAVPPATRDERGVLVWRRELVVIHRTLEADEARALPALIAGTTFGAACELLGIADDEAGAARAIELLVRWLDAQILRAPS